MPSRDEAIDIRPGKLWKRMSDQQRLSAAVAFWEDETAVEQHAEAINLIARQMKFRPRSVAGLPVQKKARYLAAIPSVPDMLIARALVAYHMKSQRPMMGAFLDFLGIAHENGVISEESVPPPAAPRLLSAAAKLAADYPQSDVTLYLSTLLLQDPETWKGLEGVPELDASGERRGHFENDAGR